MDMGIYGKIALVCGSSKGLGRGCAEALAAEGVNLVINARTTLELEKTAKLSKDAGLTEEEMDDDAMDKKASKAAKKGGSMSKIAYKLADTQKEMKSVVKKWKTSEGAEKERLTSRLKELTKIKKELEGLI